MPGHILLPKEFSKSGAMAAEAEERLPAVVAMAGVAAAPAAQQWCSGVGGRCRCVGAGGGPEIG